MEGTNTTMLTPKQELFCPEYIKTRNGTRAAIAAGYPMKTARQMAAENLTKPYIRARINELLREVIDKIKVDAQFILREILNSAVIDIADAYDENGNLKPIHEMPEPLRKAIIEVKSEELYDGRGKDRECIGTAKSIKIQDRLRALELLGKHLKMFTDVHEIPGLDHLAERLKAADERVAKEKQGTGGSQ